MSDSPKSKCRAPRCGDSSPKVALTGCLLPPRSAALFLRAHLCAEGLLMLVECENIGGLRFVGENVLIPAVDIWCVVIEPAGVVVGGSWEEDRALGIAQGLECHLFEDDSLGSVKRVRV